MAAELHPQLRAALEHPDLEQRFEVVLELRPVIAEPHGSRAERIARLESAFLASAEPVKSAVLNLGGDVLGEAWINSTLKCRITTAALKALAERDDIVKIDLPRPLSR
jgi:hypothetical protein